MTQYFSTDYKSARQRFLDAGNAAGAEVESFRNPTLASNGDELFTDTALLGRKDARKALVLISGTHGVEGYAGSGIQTGLLKEGIASRVKPDVKIIMIHALNPYGFAETRRFNEDNVDLNRNFIDHSLPAPENRDYEHLASAIAPRSLSPLVDLTAQLKILCYRLCRGNTRLQYAVTHGQYAYPEGLFYGGNETVWSSQLLHNLVDKHLSACSQVVSIDFHTGLGPYGHGEVIVNSAKDRPIYQRAVRWWGADRVKSTVTGESVSCLLLGTINKAFVELLSNAEVTAVGLEFGTLPPMDVFRALRAENWLYHHGRDSSSRLQIKERLLRSFYPDDEGWKERVMMQGREVACGVLGQM